MEASNAVALLQEHSWQLALIVGMLALSVLGLYLCFAPHQDESMTVAAVGGILGSRFCNLHSTSHSTSHPRCLRRILVLCLLVGLAAVYIYVAELSSLGNLPFSLARSEKQQTQQLQEKLQTAKLKNVTEEWLQQCAKNASMMKWTPFVTLRRDYAIGDCVRGCYKCDWHDWPENINYNKSTIIRLYSARACPTNNSQFVKGGNLDILEDILQELAEDPDKNFTVPDPDSLVLHVRIGDIIERSEDSVSTMLIEGGNPGYWSNSTYPKSIKSFYEYLENIQQAKTNKVVIVGGAHRPKFFQKSRAYLHCLSIAMHHVGINMTVLVDGGDADADFYYMTHAKQLVISGGGFSLLLGNMAQRNGGKLVGRTFRGTVK